MTRLLRYRILFFFFNDTATTEIYTLSLHDALPISPNTADAPPMPPVAFTNLLVISAIAAVVPLLLGFLPGLRIPRSEEHTSELQSQSNLVCRLLLEKKNKTEAARYAPYK